MKKILFITGVLIVGMGCQGKMGSKISDLNGFYERNCGSMSSGGNQGYAFKISNDSLVEFYECDGYDLDKDLGEEYDSNKPVSLKWREWKDVNGDLIKGKIKFIDNNHLELKYNESSDVETFTLNADGSLYREEIRTLSDKMNHPDELECKYKILFNKK
jgi:hypothetical protein